MELKRLANEITSEPIQFSGGALPIIAVLMNDRKTANLWRLEAEHEPCLIIRLVSNTEGGRYLYKTCRG